MQIINYNDLCFDELQKLNINCSESDIYLQNIENKSYIYKIFKNCLDAYSLTLKNEKLKMLEKRKNNSSLVIPDSKILDTSLVGVREEYIDGIDLSEASKIYNSDDMIKILLEVSKNLKDIHKSGIIVSDFNFANIRIDNGKKPHFLDVLSYNIDGIPENSSSYIINEYLKRYKKQFKASKNNDKIAFLMLSIQSFINKYFFDITDYDFDETKEKIEFLKNLEEVFYDLNTSYVKDAPYLHELIR